MGQIVIDDPRGFKTVYSTDYDSPARNYIREYQPKNLEDLYNIGVIPKHVSIEHLRTAREVGLRASTPYIDRILDRDSAIKEMDSMQLSRAEHQKLLIEKPANTRVINTA